MYVMGKLWERGELSAGTENGQQQRKAYSVKHGVHDVFLGKECIRSKRGPESTESVDPNLNLLRSKLQIYRMTNDSVNLHIPRRSHQSSIRDFGVRYHRI